MLFVKLVNIHLFAIFGPNIEDTTKEVWAVSDSAFLQLISNDLQIVDPERQNIMPLKNLYKKAIL